MKTKKCSICGEEKLLEEFGKFGKDKKHFRSYCKTCDNKRSREYYHNHIEQRKAYEQSPIRKEHSQKKARVYYKKHRDKITARMRSKPTIRYNLLNDIGLLTDCVICGYSKDKFAAIQFHHINPEEKIQTIGIMAPRFKKYPDNVFIKEAQKCICMCANCHMLYHAGDKEVVEKYNNILNIQERNFK